MVTMCLGGAGCLLCVWIVLDVYCVSEWRLLRPILRDWCAGAENIAGTDFDSSCSYSLGFVGSAAASGSGSTAASGGAD